MSKAYRATCWQQQVMFLRTFPDRSSWHQSHIEYINSISAFRIGHQHRFPSKGLLRQSTDKSHVTNMLHDQLCARIRKETFHFACVDLNRQAHTSDVINGDSGSVAFRSVSEGTTLPSMARADRILVLPIATAAMDNCPVLYCTAMSTCSVQALFPMTLSTSGHTSRPRAKPAKLDRTFPSFLS